MSMTVESAFYENDKSIFKKRIPRSIFLKCGPCFFFAEIHVLLKIIIIKLKIITKINYNNSEIFELI
jgi:hypothetical protein